LSPDNVVAAGKVEMPLGAVNHIALTVTDLARSVAFYRPMLAFLGYRLAMTA
jgi:hypothetical protein